MTGEELPDEVLMSLFEAARCRRLIIINLGNSFMQGGIQNNGTDSSIF